MDRSECGCVYADSSNTAAVRLGHEMGGYIKTPCARHAAPPPPARYECLRGAKCKGRDCPDCANFSPPPAEQASGGCKGPNCTASVTNDYKHSSECLFEHAANVASGIESVEMGVEIAEHLTYVEWRGHRINLLAALSQRPVVGEVECNRDCDCVGRCKMQPEKGETP